MAVWNRRCLLFAPLVLLFAARVACAICVPDRIYNRYVGNVATDSQCTDNDIQSAINNATCPSVIYVTDEHTYTAQHLDINNKNVTLVGTTQACGPQACDTGCVTPTTPQVTLDGSGHSGDSVLYVHGTSNVTLKYLHVTHGNNINGSVATYGGGVHFDGAGSLTLDTVTIDNNTAQFGGGIDMSGTSGFAALSLLGNTQIIGNTAGNSGGGIRISDNTYMSALADRTLIANNHAPDGYGGGVNVVGPAHADIGSPGLGVGVIYGNDAKYGGGMAITASSTGDAELQLFSTDPLRPVRVQGNFASTKGGALYLKGYASVPSIGHGSACMYDFRIDANAAPEGSAVYGDYDTSLGDAVGSYVLFNDGQFCRGLPASARRCAPGIECNVISDNSATDSAANATLGATLYVAPGSYLKGNRFALLRNDGGYAVRESSFSSSLSNCLFADNDLTRNLIFSAPDGGLTMDSCTLAGNTILSTDTLHVESALTLSNSIIDQPGNLTLAYSGNASDLHVNYVLASDTTTLPEVAGVATGRPTYVAAGDYHLALHSLGVDFAPPINGDDRDLDGLPHDQDLPEVANAYGVRDLGAYERQLSCGAADTVFCNGFQL